MARIRIFISVDDRRGTRAIEYLIKQIDRGDMINAVVKSLMPCSSKMTRILNAAIRSYDHVIVLTDAETNNPEELAQIIIGKHGLDAENVKVIPVKPCIESWPCSILGLKNCNRSPCSEGPVASLNNYMKKHHRRDYKKKYLYDVFMEAFHECNCEELIKDNRVPPSLKMFVSHILKITNRMKQ